MTSEAIAPELGLGTPFSDDCADDREGRKVYTKLEKEQIWQCEHLIREGYARDMPSLLRKMVTEWLELKGAVISRDDDYDSIRRSWQMQQQMQFMLDRDHEIEHLPAKIHTALSKLLTHCDHKKLAQQVIKLWEQAQASDEYWRRQYTAMFRETAILRGSVATLNRVGWPLPGDLVTHVLGGASESERQPADREHHQAE